jgi:hypothetical protein
VHNNRAIQASFQQRTHNLVAGLVLPDEVVDLARVALGAGEDVRNSLPVSCPLPLRFTHKRDSWNSHLQQPMKLFMPWKRN